MRASLLAIVAVSVPNSRVSPTRDCYRRPIPAIINGVLRRT